MPTWAIITIVAVPVIAVACVFIRALVISAEVADS